MSKVIRQAIAKDVIVSLVETGKTRYYAFIHSKDFEIDLPADRDYYGRYCMWCHQGDYKSSTLKQATTRFETMRDAIINGTIEITINN